MSDTCNQKVSVVVSEEHSAVAEEQLNHKMWHIRVTCNKHVNEQLAYVLVTSRDPATHVVKCLNCQAPLF